MRIIDTDRHPPITNIYVAIIGNQFAQVSCVGKLGMTVLRPGIACFASLFKWLLTD